MSMTQENKEYYIELIHEIWPATQQYTADDVNEDAARIVDFVVDEIESVCRPILYFAVTIKNLAPLLISRSPLSWTRSAVNLVKDLIKASRSHPRYRVIADSAALKNRSMIEIALMNI